MPFGSAAHGMLLKALVDRGLSQEFFTLINQAPPIGATSVQEKKIDAHADFCPWGELMEFKGFARKIFDGSQASVAYLHGPVVRKDFLEKYPEIIVAYLKAVIEANEWITRNPEEATTKQEQWTSIPKEVLYLYFGRGGFLTLDATIKPKWVEVLKYDASVLQKMGIIKGADVEGFIDDRFVKQAYRELGRDYAREQRLMVAGTSPMEGKDASMGPRSRIRVRRPRVAEGRADQALRVAGELDGCPAGGRAGGRVVSAAYVFDYPTGLKLFAHRASTSRAAAARPSPRLARRVRLEGRSRSVRHQERRQGPLARGSEEAGGRREVATAPLVGAPAAPADAAEPLRLVGWRRPALRALSIGLFLLAWHVSTLWDLDLYVRFQNIPAPGDVLVEAIALFSSASFYVHILASLERIWLGFAIATVLGVGLGLVIGCFAFAEDLLFPPIELLRPIPAVAWVPISIMLWPTERSSIVFITTLGAFFPIVLNRSMASIGIDRQLVRGRDEPGVDAPPSSARSSFRSAAVDRDRAVGRDGRVAGSA